MEKQKHDLGFTVHMNLGYEEAIQRVTEALKQEGFGVLTEIDVQETLKNKLGIDFYPYKILGACNPPLAHQALTIAPEVGLLLPCNVTVRQAAGEKVEVSLVDPLVMLGAAAEPALQPVAEEARLRLERVVQALEAG